MKQLKKLALAALLVGSMSSGALEAKAEGLDGFYLAPEVAYVLPVDGDVDDTIFLGARAGYMIDENWGLELESGWMEFGWDATDAFQNVDVTTVPVMLNARYGQRCSAEEPGWYAFAGVGMGINSIQDNDLNADVDNNTLWQVGVGAETPITDGVDAFLDVRYLYNNINIDAPQAVTATVDDINATSVLFTGGFKF